MPMLRQVNLDPHNPICGLCGAEFQPRMLGNSTITESLVKARWVIFAEIVLCTNQPPASRNGCAAERKGKGGNKCRISLTRRM